ncbi:hypothetical protein [Streptomyces griseoaurantiacus]|uniref:hypothetical protein n=1 Tax=Streptomyces griseoaurantiacus TaxID=68213 RepID=UPI003697FD31
MSRKIEVEDAKRLRRVSKQVWGVVGQGLSVSAEVLIQVSLSGASWPLRAGIFAPSVAIVYVIWRLHLHPFLAFCEKYVVVENVLATYCVPYSMIESCEGRRSVVIRVAGEGVIPVLAFDSSFLGGRRGIAVREELRRRASSPAVKDGATFTKEVGLGTPDVLAISLALSLVVIYWTG